MRMSLTRNGGIHSTLFFMVAKPGVYGMRENTKESIRETQDMLRIKKVNNLSYKVVWKSLYPDRL